jgi:hypothetical protein
MSSILIVTEVGTAAILVAVAAVVFAPENVAAAWHADRRWAAMGLLTLGATGGARIAALLFASWWNLVVAFGALAAIACLLVSLVIRDHGSTQPNR